MKLEVSDPLAVTSPKECSWYQAFDLPDGTHIRGRWDYRRNVDDYIGRLDYGGKRVVEIGPASGYLTRAMEQRGADVLCVDVSSDAAWDIVPRLDRDTAGYAEARKAGLPRLWKGWWLTRSIFNGTARMSYSGADALARVEPEDYGFDIALVGSVLQHFANPYVILSHLARLCPVIVVTEQYMKRLDVSGRPICEFIPRSDSNDLGSWWQLSNRMVEQMMATLNFRKTDSYFSDFIRWDLKADEASADTFRSSSFYTHIYERIERDESKFGNLLET